jgi:hypothetical protein
MQLQSLLILLFLLFIVPMVILFANPDIFFIIVSIILFILSLRSIHIIIFNIKEDSEELDDELIEDLEMTLNIDVRKFSKGIKVGIDLIFMLFFIYCFFYINSYWLRVACCAIMLYWYTDILRIMGKFSVNQNNILRNLTLVLVHSLTIILITIVICNKFMSGIV